MKKSKLAITAALVAALGLTPALGACSGDKYDEIKFAAQDTSYVVTSQGGNAVAYGNYVYFINGTRGYDDTDGNANVWGSVVKGALYRAELNGAKVDGTPATFSPTVDGEAVEFKYTDGTDYFDAPTKNVDVTAIAPKTVGTSGYTRGGLFIYDNYAYFASPNNSKDKMGNIQTTRTDFFMMPLSGGKPTRIYTTSEGVDTSSSAYAFYKYGGKVYLVVNEGGTIVSVGINTSKAKADDPVSYNVGATSVYFPVRDEYYNGISTDTPEDFIYYVRAVDEDKGEPKVGTVIEGMRPDGSEQFKMMNGNTETIEAVRDGVLFVRSTDSASNKTYMTYTNLHDVLMEKSPSYRAAQDAKGSAANVNVAGRFQTEINSSVTSTYAVRPDVLSNTVYYIGVTDSAMSLYETDGSVNKIADVTGTVQFVRNNYVYYAGSSNDYYRVPLWENIAGDEFGEAQTLAENTTSSGAPCDYVGGYFTYYAEVDQWANAYTHFYKVDGIAGAEPLFVGARASFDIPTEEQIKEAKGETDETEE